MPEGPECHLICDSIKKLIKKCSLVRMDPIVTRPLKQAINDKNAISQFPLQVKSVRCKGKLIYFHLHSKNPENEDWYIYNTLGLTGGWTLKKGEYTRICFIFKNPDGKKIKLYWYDQIGYGTLKFVRKSELIKKLNELGSDPLLKKSSISSKEFARLALEKWKTKNICCLLMEQKCISGVGNYLKAESLYRCKINPHHLVSDLSVKKLTKLFRCIKKLMKKSYKLRGATIYSFLNGLTGEVGEMTSHFKVYNLKEDSLGNKIIKEKTADKRMTHWVPEIQK